MELLSKPPTTKLSEAWFTGDAHPGDAIWTPPGEEHWHGAAPDRFMTHLALWESDEATWLEHVTEAEYTASRSSTRAGA